MSEEFDKLFPYKPPEENSVANRLVSQLRKMIFDETLQPGTRLPNEPEFAARMNVSRSTLRTALQILEREGFIIRRRGIGTFIVEEPLKFNNLNLNWGVSKVIESIGAVPGTIELFATYRPASQHVAKRLNIKEGTKLVTVERVRTANDRRVVYMIDHIPCSLLKTPEGEISAQGVEDYLRENKSMYVFLRKELSLDIHHAVAWISPLSADKLIADKLQVPLGSGILYLEQVDYSPSGEPCTLADEYHVANAFTFTVYRSDL
jgi:GntR family transcriptional regulator